MQKISWLASYPKSGNTYMRLLLSSYFYTANGNILDFNSIENIFKISRYDFLQGTENIPSLENFLNNPRLISQYWSKAQEAISKKINKNLFIKTHDCMANVSNNYFTSEKYTKCFIYLVRDPRSVAVSYSKHTGYDLEKMVKFLINKDYIITYDKKDRTVPELVSSWAIHYNSWKKFLNKGNGIIIKFEDLVNDPKKEFLKVLMFLKEILYFEIDEKKINNCIESTKLSKLKSMETKIGFKEKPSTSNSFFRKGITDEWKNVLSEKQIKLIEENFYNEMKELKYL